MLNRARAVALGIAGLTLAACGNIHPGDAAVVDGESISMKTLNDTAAVYCTLTLASAQQQGVTTVPNSDVRRQAVTSLVSMVVARKLAKDKGIEVEPSRYDLTTSQEQQIAKAFPKDDAEKIGKAIEDSQEVSEIAIALGETSTGEKRTDTNEADLAQAGQEEITKAFADNGVKFAPRFGLDATTKAISDTGSLSVAQVDLDKKSEDELPAAQRCS